MRSPFLRSFRIFFSALILICFFVVFADFRYFIPTKYINILLWLQFIPSILKFHDLGTIVTAGFAAILILTIISGRTYCSFLCPLGVAQDISSRIGGRIRRKFRRYGYKRPFTILRYVILVVTIVVSVFSGVYLLTLLDPYSIYGRTVTYFFKPVVIVINNFFTWVLGKFDNYSLHHVTVNGYNLFSYLIPAAFLLLFGLISLAKGRLYCNMICPVGTLLGLFSKVSLLRIKFDEEKCTKCGRCSVGCKSSCIDFLQQKVDVSRCVDCFNCIKICPDKALSYGFVRIKKKIHVTDTEKRKFVAGAIGMIFGLPDILNGQGNQIPVPQKQSTVPENRTLPVCPPGAGSIEDFNKDCIACSLCITACPNGVLKPALLQYGIMGIMQPVMDYHKSFCTFNCTRCTEVCPTYALRPLLPEAKKLTQLGKVNFIKDNCIVKTEKTTCGACSESCPTKAVYMIPYEGNLLIPETNVDICIGCGHCEFACPTKPYKAIFVDGNPVHLAAEKPDETETDVVSPVDFPF
ncbi:MAG TPA: 4Fe-4S ferredoxin [Bacteroidales bacterium]|nr:4Fe-4S ferredoxin [Bacteroidales bacterium]